MVSHAKRRRSEVTNPMILGCSIWGAMCGSGSATAGMMTTGGHRTTALLGSMGRLHARGLHEEDRGVVRPKLCDQPRVMLLARTIGVQHLVSVLSELQIGVEVAW